MGITATRPYIIDEFESEDDSSFEPALDYIEDSVSLNPVNAVNERIGHLSTGQTHGPDADRQTHGVHSSRANSENNLQGLEELLKLLENHDFDGAQKAASLLKKNAAFSQFGSPDIEESRLASVSESAKSANSSTVTSTWSTNTEEDLTEVPSGSILLHTETAEDLTEDQLQVLVMLDEELTQFEANEEKIASEPNVFHSGIPRLISARSSSGSTGTHGDASRKTPDRKRSPSPSGRLKTSGIPRYSWAHVTGSPSSPGESKLEHRLDASSLSDTLASLPELTDRLQANRRLWDKTFVVDKTGTSTGRSESSLTSGQSGDTSAPDINISDQTGRARVRKRHFCLPASWTKPEEFQRLPSKGRYNTMQSNSSSSHMANAEILACKTIGECGDPSERKVLDLKRWYCISRPQYRSSCGISAIVSCWNYLFSTVGHGRLKPVTQEAAMKMFGFTSPFDEISFGPITGNVTLLRWFKELCSHFNVNGHGFILYKPSGTNQTDGVTEEMALDFLKKGLKDTSTAFIYHCHNHYFCPIGYEDTPEFCVDVYRGNVGNSSECWVLIGDTSRKYPSVHCVSWDQICQDLNCKSPSFINIRQIWKGVQQQKTLKTCGCNENLHCILAFQTVSDDTQSSSNSQSSSSNASSVTKSSHLQPNSPPKFEVPTVNALSKASTHRPELGDDFKTDYQEDEVGVVKSGSNKSSNKHVDETESSVSGVDISVNGGESSVSRVDISANGGESSVNRVDVSVNGGESSVNWVDISVKNVESSEEECESSVNEDKRVKEVESSVNGDGSSVNGGESSVNGDESSVNGGESSVTGGEISGNGGEISLNGGEISLNGGEISVKKIECSLEEGESSVKEGESSVNGGENSGEESESSVKEIEKSAKEDESSLKEGESSVKEVECSAKEDQISLKECESSVVDSESSVREGESSVNGGDNSVNGVEISVNVVGNSGEESENSVKEYESLVKEDESSGEESESSVKEIENSVKEDEISVKEDESLVIEDEISVKEDESSVKEGERSGEESESSIKEVENSVNEDESSVKADESSGEESESSIKEVENSVKEDESSVKEDESSVKEDESSGEESESSIKEVENSVKEDESSVKEDESSMKEGERSVNEGESVNLGESSVQEGETLQCDQVS